jgi:hypothetical protein
MHKVVLEQIEDWTNDFHQPFLYLSRNNASMILKSEHGASKHWQGIKDVTVTTIKEQIIPFVSWTPKQGNPKAPFDCLNLLLWRPEFLNENGNWCSLACSHCILREIWKIFAQILQASLIEKEWSRGGRIKLSDAMIDGMHTMLESSVVDSSAKEIILWKRISNSESIKTKVEI